MEPLNRTILIVQALLSDPTPNWSAPALYCSFFVLPLLSVFWVFGLFSKTQGNALVDVPIIGPKDTIQARYNFYKQAELYVKQGYVTFKDSMYKLSGQDILVLPRKYVDELRNMPDHKLSSIQANIDNFEGLYSTTGILLEGHLHTHTIQTRLTPKLASLVPVTQKELHRALGLELPANKEDYINLKAFHLVLRLVSHVAARHFVGYPRCEDEEWLSTALKYTENAFRTIIVVRIFPNWLKPLVALLIPYSYKVSSALRKAQRIIVPMVIERRKAENEGDPLYVKPNDFLQWMMDESDEFDGQPHKLAHRLLILTLAAVHTTSMAATQTLFDLCVHPEYMEPLREEISQAVQEDGAFTKQTLTKLRKLDSFMRESQRLNPPSLLGFKRAVKEPISLSDGTLLPQGVHLMMPIYPIVIDEDVTPNPLRFEGFRHYQNRLLPGEGTRHQFATTSNTNMHFGHGKYSCPGRFFAANTIKMIISNFLLRYDFHLAEGKERPRNICLHEYVFPNPDAEVRFKLRPDEINV